MFSVKEPAGWTTNTEMAHDFGANVVFYPKGSDLRSPTTPLIRVTVGTKYDEDTEQDLKHDMDGYRARFPKVEFRENPVSHLEYRTFARLFCVPGQFYEYVAYLNPGTRSTALYSVSLWKPDQEATEQEFAAYGQVVANVRALAAP